MGKFFAFLTVLLIFESSLPKICLATLGQTKSVNNQQPPRLNNFAKMAKKEMGSDEMVMTRTTPLPSTTTRIIPAKDFNVEENADPFGNAPERTHRIIQATAILCGVSVLIILIILLIRFSFYFYKAFKQANSESDSTSPAVYYRNSTSHGAAAGPPNLYAVMPGHFVLQPCYTNTSNNSNGSASNARRGRNSSVCLPSDNIQIVTVRPETPPPPYPGTEK